jgi:hypothetical protein
MDWSEAGGWGTVSTAAVIAGTLVALATTGVLLGALGGLARAIAGTTSVPRSATTWGIAGAITTVACVWAAFTFGGYASGRLARRAGATNGFLVFFTTFVASLVGLAVFVRAGDGATLGTWLHNAGVRGTGGWMTIGAVTGLGSLALMIIGSTLGGAMGERWHTLFVERALAARAETHETGDRDVVDVRDDASRRHQVRAADSDVVSDDVTAERTTVGRERDDVLPQGRR